MKTIRRCEDPGEAERRLSLEAGVGHFLAQKPDIARSVVLLDCLAYGDRSLLVGDCRRYHHHHHHHHHYRHHHHHRHCPIGGPPRLPGLRGPPPPGELVMRIQMCIDVYCHHHQSHHHRRRRRHHVPLLPLHRHCPLCPGATFGAAARSIRRAACPGGAPCGLSAEWSAASWSSSRWGTGTSSIAAVGSTAFVCATESSVCSTREGLRQGGRSAYCPPPLSGHGFYKNAAPRHMGTGGGCFAPVRGLGDVPGFAPVARRGPPGRRPLTHTHLVTWCDIQRLCTTNGCVN
jgi:hypothetical protein